MGSAPGVPHPTSSKLEPVNISHRFILRAHGTLPVKRLVNAQRLFKHDNARMNELLSRVIRGDITSPGNTLIFFAIISFFEE